MKTAPTATISKNGLVELTGLPAGTVRKRIQSLTPVETQGSWKFYNTQEALEAVYCPDDEGELQSLSRSQKRKLAAEADLAEIKRDAERGKLVEADAIKTVIAKFAFTTRNIILASPLDTETKHEVLQSLADMGDIDVESIKLPPKESAVSGGF